MENMVIQLLFLCAVSQQVSSVMVMDETSCVERVEEECGICHTIYMEECKMKMVEEMMPTRVSMCKNVTRYGIEYLKICLNLFFHIWL